MSVHGPDESTLRGTVDFLPLWYPTPSAIHPRWQELDGPSLEWAQHTGMVQTATELERLRRMEGGKLAACVYPHGLYDQLLWETKLNVFLFSFDDAYCDIGEASRKPGELARVTNQLTYVLETPAAAAFHAEPFAVAVRELRRELDGFATPTQVTRWVHTFSAYLHRQTLHAAYREREEFPPFDDFFAARLDTSGSKSLGSQGDIIEGFEVPLGEWRHPEVQAVVDACGATVAITNDLFSYNEERQEKREWVHNLVELFAAYYRCSRQDAALKTVVEYEKVIRAYLALRERIQRWGSPELNRYVDLCGHWPRANHDWAITSARYNQVRTPGFPVEPAAESLWATQRLERSQLSPIQWWWDLLEGE